MTALDRGAPIAAVARFHGIPTTSLADHVNRKIQGRKRGSPPILNQEEEKALETYMLQMADYGHPLTTEQLRLKVTLLTQERVIVFTNGIFGIRWLHWFQKRHPHLTRRQSQELQFSRVKGLCAKNVATFYENLQQLYEKYEYPPENIWNCDESGAQAGKSGGGRVWCKKRNPCNQQLNTNKARAHHHSYMH